MGCCDFSEEERWSLWACGVFDSVGKVKETRIMVLVVAGDWSVASGCGYGTVMWYLSWFGGADRWLWGVGQRRRWGLGCDKRRRNC